VCELEQSAVTLPERRWQRGGDGLLDQPIQPRIFYLAGSYMPYMQWTAGRAWTDGLSWTAPRQQAGCDGINERNLVAKLNAPGISRANGVATRRQDRVMAGVAPVFAIGERGELLGRAPVVYVKSAMRANRGQCRGQVWMIGCPDVVRSG
jgi:hypothetical protein